MFLAIGISMLYVGARLALRRNVRGIAMLVGVIVIGVVALQFFPVQGKVEARLSGDANSNTDRLSLYVDALELIPDSPVFGFGGPQPSFDPALAPVGTQGQVWLLLVSHGPIATLCFVMFFLLAFWRIRRRVDPMGIACATVVLVGTIELAYYGVVPNGLPLMLIAAAVGLREGRVRS
jgi:polysaccharide biosynthesis protein PslJ